MRRRRCEDAMVTADLLAAARAGDGESFRALGTIQSE